MDDNPLYWQERADIVTTAYSQGGRSGKGVF
ncbi:MAG: hypothetical protein ACJAYN_001763, partial [Bermanella sp.]